MNREKITFPTNVPVFVKLDRNPPADPMPNCRFGDEYMYVCNDDAQVLFAKPELHTLILAAGAKAGCELAITKAETKTGNRKTTAWQVEPIQDEPADTPRARTDAHPAAKNTSTPPAAPRPEASAAAAAPQQRPQPAPKLAEALCELHREANCPLCRQQASGSPNPLSGPLQLAIDAAAVAELYAHRRGLAVRFSGEDIRALALSLYIDGSRRANNGGARQ
jgi:hypothetical protein